MAKKQLLAIGGKLMKDGRKEKANKVIRKLRIPKKAKTMKLEQPQPDPSLEINFKSTEKRKVKDTETNFDEENRLKISKQSTKLKMSPRLTHICQFCGFQTSLHSQFRLHLKRHDLTCDICSIDFTNKTDLKRHRHNVHNSTKVQEFTCDFCNAKITKLPELSRHLKLHVKPKQECKICNQKLKNLPKHMKEVHTTVDRPFICSICGAGFKYRNNLSSHVKIHEEPSECPICHKFLPNMQQHLQRHQRPKPAPVQCPQCLKNCATKHSLQEHIHRVHEKVPLGKCYTCTICNLNFIRNTDLRRHSYIHYTGKIYACTFPRCNEMFKKSFKLQSHLMVHNDKNEANFLCDWCDRKYLRKTALHKHIKASHPEVKMTETISIKIIKKVC